MSDYIHKLEFMEEKNLTLEISYRLNYEDKACGSIRIFSGQIDPEKDNYELYMELLECGLTEDEVNKRVAKMEEEINQDKIDLSL
jgi:molybdopterin synthase catalytic subunit